MDSINGLAMPFAGFLTFEKSEAFAGLMRTLLDDKPFHFEMKSNGLVKDQDPHDVLDLVRDKERVVFDSDGVFCSIRFKPHSLRKTCFIWAGLQKGVQPDLQSERTWVQASKTFTSSKSLRMD